MTLFVSALQGEPDQAFRIARRPRLERRAVTAGRLSVTERGEWSGILAFSVEGTDPELVRRQVNEIANVYVRQNVERKSAEAQQTLEFLDEQLPIVRQNMEAAELALNSYRLEKGSIDLPLETQTILQTIVSIEAQTERAAPGTGESHAGVHRSAPHDHRPGSPDRPPQRGAESAERAGQRPADRRSRNC